MRISALNYFVQLRLVLSGGIAGTAIFGVLASLFGVDVAAALAGGGMSAAWIKAARLI
jgi:hypothetical protein